MPLTEELIFHTNFTDELPADKEQENYTRQVQNAAYSYVQPVSFAKPKCIITSKEMIDELVISDPESDSFVNLFSGKKIPNHTKPYAMAYAGHQFGQWAGQLGDGRAINLGELKGKTSKWQVQLKGAGPTPYSRSGDGFAVLRSSIREFIISEAMHHLGIASTRALSLMETGEKVLRDKLYDGNSAYEKGAVLCRLSPSFIRFGNFELLAARNDIKTLKRLTDYTIKHYYNHLLKVKNDKERYIQFLKTVSKRTQKTIINWMRVGFVHAVMNTDNMSILGETIDYGPFGWIDNYDRNWTPNTTDKYHKRYRFGNQLNIGQWNLMQLCNALFPLIKNVRVLQDILDDYHTDIERSYYEMQHEKIGLKSGTDQEFIDSLLDLLEMTEIDMTLFYRILSKFETADSFFEQLDSMSYKPESILKYKSLWLQWLSTYAKKIDQEEEFPTERIKRMNRVNPKYVIRNYMIQEAIEKAENEEYSMLYQLHNLSKNPYKEQKSFEKWFTKRPDWAKDKFGCSTLSCSS